MSDEKTHELKFTLSADDVKDVMRQALLQALQPEKRDKLITEAISKLLEGNWQRHSELQDIFSRSCRDVAMELARAEFSKPENQEKLRALIAEAWDKRLIGENREKLIDRIGEAMSRGVFGER